MFRCYINYIKIIFKSKNNFYCISLDLKILMKIIIINKIKNEIFKFLLSYNL
jgi:hypothetical protein